MNKNQQNSPQPIDERSLQNGIRHRYKQDWPAIILQLTKRVRAVNNQWAAIMNKILFIDGLSVTYKRSGDGILVLVKYHTEEERHEISIEEVQKAMPYIEVLIMDKLSKSLLIAKVSR